MIQHTNVRFAVDHEGRPIREEATFRLVEEGGYEADWHAEVAPADAPNQWALTIVAHPLVHPEADLTGGFYLRLPLAAGVRIVNEAQYDAAVAKWDAAQKARWEKGAAEALLEAQKAWDAKSARYRRLGWTPTDVIAEFGARPTVPNHDAHDVLAR